MNYIITKTPETFSFGNYNFCGLENMELPELLAKDTETTGLDPLTDKLFCIQLGTGTNNYLIDMQLYALGQPGSYTPEDVWPYLVDKILCYHNAAFDLGFCYKAGFIPKRVRDTLLASRILHNGDVTVRHDFGTMMQRELGIVYDKTDQKNISKVMLSQPSTVQYSFNDVDRLLEAHTRLCTQIDDDGFRPTYDLHCRNIRAIAYMELCGLPISKELWSKKMAEDDSNKAKYLTEINDYIFDHLPVYRKAQIDMFDSSKKITVLISSPKQMIPVFNALGIKTKDDKDNDTINEQVLKKTKHEFVTLWLKYQEASHRVSTFGKTIYDKIVDGRIYTRFNPMVDTARLSTRKGYINFLNFPRDKATRYCFEAKEGNVMVVCDYGAQEGVIMADLSGDKAMTASVVDGEDLHCMFARVLFPELLELSDEDITKDYGDKRQAAKVPRFLFSYGGNAYTLHTQEGIPMSRATEIDAGFKELHAGLYSWGERVYQESIRTGYIESADGWKLKLPGFDYFRVLKNKVLSMSSEAWQTYGVGKTEYKNEMAAREAGVPYVVKFRNAYNFYKDNRDDVSKYFKRKSEYEKLCLNNPVQTRGSHQTKRAAALFFEWLEENDLLWKVLICNIPHDEFAVEAPAELGELVKHNLSRIMVQAGNYYLKNLTIKADAKINTSWGAAK